MNSPLVLVLLCGLCLTALGPADAIPDNVHQDIQKLTEHFNITADLSLFGGPIFLQDIVSHDKVEKSEQMLVLQESLVVYIRILSDMLNSTQDREIKMSIIAIRGRMEHLWSSYFHTRPDALLGRLRELWYLKVNQCNMSHSLSGAQSVRPSRWLTDSLSD
uniref:IFN-gamma-related protein n=1 Tax=Anguilla japonica TaxID=7937 RepID=A0A1D9CIZ5_ANGJA|nr:IFN-gamma precursor-related protein [Anguilla japonica]